MDGNVPENTSEDWSSQRVLNELAIEAEDDDVAVNSVLSLETDPSFPEYPTDINSTQRCLRNEAQSETNSPKDSSGDLAECFISNTMPVHEAVELKGIPMEKNVELDTGDVQVQKEDTGLEPQDIGNMEKSGISNCEEKGVSVTGGMKPGNSSLIKNKNLVDIIPVTIECVSGRYVSVDIKEVVDVTNSKSSYNDKQMKNNAAVFEEMEYFGETEDAGADNNDQGHTLDIREPAGDSSDTGIKGDAGVETFYGHDGGEEITRISVDNNKGKFADQEELDNDVEGVSDGNVESVVGEMENILDDVSVVSNDIIELADPLAEENNSRERSDNVTVVSDGKGGKEDTHQEKGESIPPETGNKCQIPMEIDIPGNCSPDKLTSDNDDDISKKSQIKAGAVQAIFEDNSVEVGKKGEDTSLPVNLESTSDGKVHELSSIDDICINLVDEEEEARVGEILDTAKAGDKEVNDNVLSMETEMLEVVPELNLELVQSDGEDVTETINLDSDGEKSSSSLAENEARAPENGKEESGNKLGDGENVEQSPGGRPKRRAAEMAVSKIKVHMTGASDNKLSKVEILHVPNFKPCFFCKKAQECNYHALCESKTVYICSEKCLGKQEIQSLKLATFANNMVADLRRRCGLCHRFKIVEGRSLTWGGMDFCNEVCLGCYQANVGTSCLQCKRILQGPSMGKYCLRFGLDLKQFCSITCLEEHKKLINLCPFCQKAERTPDGKYCKKAITDKKNVKEFCNATCVNNYQFYLGSKMEGQRPSLGIDVCIVCRKEDEIKVQARSSNGKVHNLCGEDCFSAMTVKKRELLNPSQCRICNCYFVPTIETFLVPHGKQLYEICGKLCLVTLIMMKRHIVICNWCYVKKHNFDMIVKNGNKGQPTVVVCSLNCLNLYLVSINAQYTLRMNCNFCLRIRYPKYYFSMTDATLCVFCSLECANKMTFSQGEAQPVEKPKVVPIPTIDEDQGGPSPKTRISVVNTNKLMSPSIPTDSQQATSQLPGKCEYVLHTVVMPQEPVECCNFGAQCSVNKKDKNTATECKTESVKVQTDPRITNLVIPIPVPVYVPVPFFMFNMPYPVPWPVAVPAAVPVVLPTTQKTFQGVCQELRRIYENTPTDPLEADILAMAEIIAEEREKETESEVSGVVVAVEANEDNVESDDATSDSKVAKSITNGFPSLDLSPTTTCSNFFTHDLPVLDLARDGLDTEGVSLPAPSSHYVSAASKEEKEKLTSDKREMKGKRGRPKKRSLLVEEVPAPSNGSISTRLRAKKRKTVDECSMDGSLEEFYADEPDDQESLEETPKPKTKMQLNVESCLKVWDTWATRKNESMLLAASRAGKHIKPLETNFMKLTQVELNRMLRTFVQDLVDSSQYPPDAIFYYCLGLQLVLRKNKRKEDIFGDRFFEEFTNAFHEVVSKNYCRLASAGASFTSCIEEEYLWESYHLGAHSPQALLFTLMYYNTKYFQLKTLDEHLQLSFTHVVKRWENIGSRNAKGYVLRFHPPKGEEKIIYGMNEVDEIANRCPVRMYEFYLSRCSSSVKCRSDVFYMEPEVSVNQDSPLWFSNAPLDKNSMMKIFLRIMMVRDVSEALYL